MASTNPTTGPPTVNITYREALNSALFDEMASDPSVFVFGLDVPDHKRIYGSTERLVEEFGPERCFGTPLSEDAMTGVALGAAISGMKPVHIHIRVDFLLLAMNQLLNMVSTTHYLSGGKLRAPMVIRAVVGRGWGQGAQHSKTLHNYFAHVPGLKVMMPTTPQDAYSMLRSAIQDPNPVVFLEHRWLYDIHGEVDKESAFSPSCASVLREGDAVSMICTSWMTVEAMKAADVLAQRGIPVEVVDVRSIAPLDEKTIVDSVRKTGHCIVMDYDWVYCGFSSEVSALVSEQCFGQLKKPVQRLGFEPAPCPTTRPLENQFYAGAKDAIRAVEKLLEREEADLSAEEFYTYEHRFKGPF